MGQGQGQGGKSGYLSGCLSGCLAVSGLSNTFYFHFTTYLPYLLTLTYTYLHTLTLTDFLCISTPRCNILTSPNRAYRVIPFIIIIIIITVV